MARPKKQQPNRPNGTFEYKATVGHTVEGKAIRKSFYSPISVADAKAKSEQYRLNQAMIQTVGVTSETASSITFKIWARKWLIAYKKPNVTAQTYRNTYESTVENHLIPYFGNAKLVDLKQIDVQNFYASKCNTCSESLMNKFKLCLCGIFDTAIENDLIYKNPAKRASYVSNVPKHEKQVYTDSQIKKAKNYFKTHFPDVFILLETGMRRGELLGLMWDDVDFNNNTLKIDRSVAEKQGGGVEIVPPKWSSNRVIPISKELADMLKTLPKSSDYVLPNINGKVQSPRQWSRKLDRHMKAMVKDCSGMIELTAHELRHTRGTQLRRAGVDIYTIQKLLGHKDINVTAQVYVHDDIETTRAAAKII